MLLIIRVGDSSFVAGEMVFFCCNGYFSFLHFSRISFRNSLVLIFATKSERSVYFVAVDRQFLDNANKYINYTVGNA